MIYLTGVTNPTIEAYARREPALGLMAQPGNGVLNRIQHYQTWAADNGAFGAWVQQKPFPVAKWSKWVQRLPVGPLFVVVPDAVGDHDATTALWDEYHSIVADLGHRAAFVLQNGCLPATVPWDTDAVFIGGDTAWKLSAEAGRIVMEAQRRGVWVHMGRVNSTKRWLRALAMGCDSADGTFLRFGPPELMLSKVSSWLYAGRNVGGQIDLLDQTVSA